MRRSFLRSLGLLFSFDVVVGVFVVVPERAAVPPVTVVTVPDVAVITGLAIESTDPNEPSSSISSSYTSNQCE